MDIICPHCQTVLEGTEDFVGTEVECPSCNKAFTVPAPQPAVPTTAEEGKSSPEEEGESNILSGMTKLMYPSKAGGWLMLISVLMAAIWTLVFLRLLAAVFVEITPLTIAFVIVAIPFAWAWLKIAHMAAWPFNKKVVAAEKANPIATLGNVLFAIVNLPVILILVFWFWAAFVFIPGGGDKQMDKVFKFMFAPLGKKAVNMKKQRTVSESTKGKKIVHALVGIAIGIALFFGYKQFTLRIGIEDSLSTCFKQHIKGFEKVESVTVPWFISGDNYDCSAKVRVRSVVNDIVFTAKKADASEDLEIATSLTGLVLGADDFIITNARVK